MQPYSLSPLLLRSAILFDQGPIAALYFGRLFPYRFTLLPSAADALKREVEAQLRVRCTFVLIV